MTQTPPENFPDWRRLAWLLAIGAALRLVLLTLIFTAGGETWAHYLSISDAGSYLKFAQVVYTGAPRASLTFYDSRVFPGWPLVYGWLLWLLPAPAAALGALILTAAAVPALLYLLTRRFAVALALVWLPPAWLLATTHPVAEAFFLLAGLGALLAWQRDRLELAGLAAGLMCATKPYGIFLALPLGLACARSQGRWSAGRLARFAWPIFATGILCAFINLRLYGDMLHQFHVYAAPLAQLNLAGVDAYASASGHWSMPFAALLTTPWRTPVPAWKMLYVYAHVVALFVLVTVPAWRCWRARANNNALTLVLLGWLVLNSAAIVCGGPYWGFHSFDRYFVWAWPAALVLNADFVEKHPRLHAAAAAISILLTLFAIHNHHA
jgi:hypothetical protein